MYAIRSYYASITMCLRSDFGVFVALASDASERISLAAVPSASSLPSDITTSTLGASTAFEYNSLQYIIVKSLSLTHAGYGQVSNRNNFV